MANTSLSDAAALIAAAETTGLTAVKDALTVFNAALDAATSAFPSTGNFDTVRLSNALKAAIMWSAQEVDTKLAILNPQTVTTTPLQAS